MVTKHRIRSLLDWCGGYVLISFLSYAATAYSGWRDRGVQIALVLVAIATLGLNRMAHARRRRGISLETAMALAFLLVASWLLQFLTLDLIVHLRMQPDEDFWQGWWSRNGLEVLGYLPLFILVVWSDLVWRGDRRRLDR